MLTKIKEWLIAGLAVVAAILFGLLQRSDKARAQDIAKRAEVDASVSKALANELTKGEVKANEAQHDPIDIDQFTKP